MRFIVLGGYGVLVGRLARLLLQDGIEVIVAGRDEQKAGAFTRQFGGRPMRVDIAQNLSAVAKAGPEVVVDAAGPFPPSGGNPSPLARLFAQNSITYLYLPAEA